MNMELGDATFWQRLANDPASLAREVCSIDITDLSAELQRHAALYAWASAEHEAAKVLEERAKWMLTRHRAVAMLEVRPLGNEKKPIAIMEAEVDLTSSVLAAAEAYHTAQERRGVLRAMTDGLASRRDMLVQLAVRERQEKQDYFNT